MMMMVTKTVQRPDTYYTALQWPTAFHQCSVVDTNEGLELVIVGGTGTNTNIKILNIESGAQSDVGPAPHVVGKTLSFHQNEAEHPTAELRQNSNARFFKY